MRFKTLIIIYLLISLPTIAQFTFPTNSSRGIAMGGCSTTLNDYESNINNIAGASTINQWGLGINFQQNYLTKENSFKNISLAIPINSTNAIFTSYTHYGNRIYNEQQLTTGYAMHITSKIAIGLSLNYLHSSVNDSYYKPINTLTCAIGLQIYPTSKITIGTKIFNPIVIKLPTNIKTYIPTIINIGLTYKFVNKLIGTLEFEKNIHFPFISRIGFEYNITNYIFARIGFSSHPNIFSFGLGIKQQQYAIDIAAQIHSALGFTPSISAHYLF